MSGTVESRIRLAVGICHTRGMTNVSWVVENAVVDGAKNVAGRLPDNPDKFAGSEAGNLCVKIQRPGVTYSLPESQFAGDDVDAIVKRITEWASGPNPVIPAP